MTVQNNAAVAAALVWGGFSIMALMFLLFLAAPGALLWFVPCYATFWSEIRNLKRQRDWPPEQYVRAYLEGQ